MPVAEGQKLRIGFTFDSKKDWLALGYSPEECAEFNTDKEIEDVAGALRSLGYEVDIVGNIKSLTKRLTAGGHHWDFVFNVCEGSNGNVAREAHVPGLLEAWGIDFTFSDAATLALCLDKCKTKMVLDYYKVPTAPYAVVKNGSKSSPLHPHYSQRATLAIASSPYAASLSTFPLFAKPSAEGTGKGVTPLSKITNSTELEQVVRTLCEQYPRQDVLIEQLLAGREFTVGLIGTGEDAFVLGVTEVLFFSPEDAQRANPILDFYSYELKKDFTPLIDEVKCSLEDPIIRAVADVALRTWRALGCRDGGRVDVRHDVVGPGAKPFVMEVNPLAGLTRGFSSLCVLAEFSGMSYEGLIKSLVDSALKRIRAKSD